MGPRERAAVALGGAVGAGARALVSAQAPGPAPIITLLVNVAGALLLAWLLARTTDPVLRAGLGTGALGAWTTFSTLSVEVLDLLGPSPHLAVLLAAASIGAGLAGAAAGEALGARVVRP